MEIRVLQAFEGDCIYLRYPEGKKIYNIIIDGGTEHCYAQKDRRNKLQYNDFYKLINEIRDQGEKVNLLILTHVDNDHIGGLLSWFEHDESACSIIERVWFNSGQLIKEYFSDTREYDNSIKYSRTLDTGIPEGVKFENVILENKIWYREIVKSGDILKLGNLEFLILSPNDSKLKHLLYKWEKGEPDSLDTTQTNDYGVSLEDHIRDKKNPKADNAIHNGSSIAFILKVPNAEESRNFVFLGDSHSGVVIEGLKKFGYSSSNKLKAEFLKLSHHGSKYNNSNAMLSMIETSNYIISTDGKKNGHPHKKLLASIIENSDNCVLHFNYPELPNRIFSEEDFNFKAFKIKTTIDE